MIKKTSGLFALILIFIILTSCISQPSSDWSMDLIHFNNGNSGIGWAYPEGSGEIRTGEFTFTDEMPNLVMAYSNGTLNEIDFALVNITTGETVAQFLGVRQEDEDIICNGFNPDRPDDVFRVVISVKEPKGSIGVFVQKQW